MAKLLLVSHFSVRFHTFGDVVDLLGGFAFVPLKTYLWYRRVRVAAHCSLYTLILSIKCVYFEDGFRLSGGGSVFRLIAAGFPHLFVRKSVRRRLSSPIGRGPLTSLDDSTTDRVLRRRICIFDYSLMNYVRKAVPYRL